MHVTHFLTLLLVAAGCTAAPAQTYTFTTLTVVAEDPAWGDGAGGVWLSLPSSVALDTSGNILVAESGNGFILQITPECIGRVVLANFGPTGQDWLFFPSGVAVDRSGDVFIADTYDNVIRKITAGGIVITLAGGDIPCRCDFPITLPLANHGSSDGTGSGARFNAPTGLAVDASGNVFVADTGNGTIRKITAGGAVTTLAGLAGSGGSADGTGSAARFNYPCGVALDGSGNLFVADTGNSTIRKISPEGVVTTLAGVAGVAGLVDGMGSGARFHGPCGVAVDGNGNVFVADTGNHTLRKITAGGVVTTLASSTGSRGNEDGVGSFARFNGPRGIAVDDSGNVFVTDSSEPGTIRKGVPAVIPPFAVTAPQSQHINSGAEAAFSVVATGSGFSHQWKKDGAAIAGATGSTYKIANATAGEMGFYSVVVTGTGGVVESTVAILTVDTVGTSRLGNFSARGLVPAGGELVVGLVVRGSRDKSVLVRAIGPTLAGFGIRGQLVDPKLELISDGAGRSIMLNDDWAGGPMLVGAFSEVGAFPLPAGSKDAALLSTLAIAGYSARITSSVVGGSGVALAEVYDRDPAAVPSRLVNISALGLVEVGAPVLALGFVIDGAASKRVLIRAVGPGLAELGVGGVLRDPHLTIIPVGKIFTVASNDDWTGDAAITSAFATAAAFALPVASKDSAMVIRLPPGAYTVGVSGVPYTSGRVLVEIYDLDP
jgi:hypothetical protein